MTAPHVPVIANDQPLDNMHWSSPFPPHRLCVCKPTEIIGMGHQTILSNIHSILIGEYKPLNTNWFTYLIHEAMFRGLIHYKVPLAKKQPIEWCGLVIREVDNPYSIHWYEADLQKFNDQFQLREGFSLIPVQHHKEKKTT